MGRCENCGQLKVAGALVLAVVCVGFAVYDGHFANSLKSDPDLDVRRRRPGQAQALYGVSVAIAVLSVIVFAALLVGIALTLLGNGLPNVVVVVIFGGSAVVFLGVIIVAPISILAARGDVSDAYYLIDSRNYNDSTEVKEYADASREGLSIGSASLLSVNRSLRADDADEHICFTEVLTKLRLTWEFVFVYFPLSEPLRFGVASDLLPVPAPPSISYGNLYRSADRGVCYGVEWDAQSAASVLITGRMCDAKVKSVAGCAPGWSIDDLTDLPCRKWEKCMKKREENTREKQLEDLEIVGAVQQDGAWVLPTGWDQVNDLKHWEKAQSVKELDEDLAGTGLLYWPTNLALLVIGGVGWVFLVVGIVLGLLCGGNDSK
jgi:hypothetical protein